MYTRLLTGAVAKSNAEARRAYLARRRKEEAVYAGLSRRVMAKALAGEDAFDALVSALEMVRWREEFARVAADRGCGVTTGRGDVAARGMNPGGRHW